ncbi:hypothetical protein KXV85_000957, partial [Aspergillus fumigatus]
EHTCMSVRGVAKHGAMTLTSRFTGVFRDNSVEQQRFLSMALALSRRDGFVVSSTSAAVDEREEGLRSLPKFDAPGFLSNGEALCKTTDTAEVSAVVQGVVTKRSGRGLDQRRLVEKGSDGSRLALRCGTVVQLGRGVQEFADRSPHTLKDCEVIDLGRGNASGSLTRWAPLMN